MSKRYTTAEYNALPQVRVSNLKHCLTSVLDYKLALEKKWEPTEAMNFGSLCDGIWLDRENIGLDFAHWKFEDRPDKGRILKSGKNKGKWVDHGIKTDLNQEWIEGIRKANPGKTLVPWTEIARADDLVNYVRSIAKTPEAQKARDYLDNTPGEKQKVVFWTDPETGIEMKGRLDKLNPDEVVDLKVYERYHPDVFGKAAADFSLDMQAVVYMKATGRTRFVWVVIQPEFPYNVCTYYMMEGSPEYRVGENKLRTCLDRLKLAQDTGIWSGVGSTPHPTMNPKTGEFVLSMPGWHVKNWL